jgi:hypothetical protein
VRSNPKSGCDESNESPKTLFDTWKLKSNQNDYRDFDVRQAFNHFREGQRARSHSKLAATQMKR